MSLEILPGTYISSNIYVKRIPSSPVQESLELPLTALCCTNYQRLKGTKQMNATEISEISSTINSPTLHM